MIANLPPSIGETTTGTDSCSLDHLISGGQQRFRDGEAVRLGGLQIDRQFVLGRRLQQQVARVVTCQSPGAPV